jgi:DNA polymerase-3 subunit alpha
MNSKCVESLIKSGAFDSLGGKRSQYSVVCKGIHNGIGQSRRNNIAGQMNLFAMTADKPEDIYRDTLPDIEEFSHSELLGLEKELLGVYVSGHPLAEYESVLKHFVSCTTLDFPQSDEEIGAPGKIADSERVTIGGIVDSVNIKYTKKNQRMAFVTLEDMNGSVEVAVFPKVFEGFGYLLAENKVILVTGRASISEDQGSKVISDSIRAYDSLIEADKTLWIKLPQTKDIPIEAIKTMLVKNKGESKVIIYDEKNKKRMSVSPAYYAKPSEELIEELTELCGEGCVVVK